MRRPGFFGRSLAAAALAIPSVAAAQFAHPFELSSVDASSGMVLLGIDSLDFAGRQVANAGDINGDGVDDLLVAAPYADPNGSSSGEVYVVFGSALAGSGLAGDPLDSAGNLDLSALDGDNGFTIVGTTAFHRSGAAIAGLGDVNGDGIDDIAVGTVYADPFGRTDAGRTTVIFGNSEFGLGTSGDPISGGSVLSLSSVTGTRGFHIVGATAYDQLGSAIDGPGDVNGDGIDDILLGAFVSSPGGIASGQAWVVFGNAKFATGQVGDPVSLGNFDLANVNGDNGFKMPGAATRDYAGSSVAGIGDIDGDGVNDFIVGAPQADPNSGSNRGTSYVVFGTTKFGTGLAGDPLSGGSSLALSGLNGTYGFKANGVTDADKSGSRVAAAGDFDGDGLDDFLVGAPDGDNLLVVGQREGLVYLVRGNANFGTGLAGDPLSSGVLNLNLLNGTTGVAMRGISPVDLAGAGLRGGADVNLDSRSDLLVGAPDADPNGFSSGTVYLLKGAATLPGSAGVFSFSAINGTNGVNINGISGSVSGGDRAGASVAAGGDFNGDGGQDIVIASPEANLGGGREGRVHVLYGSAPADASPPTIASVTTNKANGSYKAGEQIEIRFVFSEAVIVDAAGGSPTASLNTSGTATFIDGSGSSVLRFQYTVAAGHNTADLDAVSLALGGSTIRDAAGNNATLSLPGGANSLAGGHAIVIDTVAPTIARFQSDTAAGAYGAGAVIDIDAVFSENLHIGTGAGTPTVTLDSGGTGSWTGTSGSTTISFNYTVVAGHASSDLDVTAISTAGRTFADLAGNVANLALPVAPNRLRDHEAIVLDSEGPAISQITSSKPDGHYGNGTVIDIDVVFDGPISANFAGGNPRITINTGDLVFYHSQPDSQTLRFRYTVSSTDNSSDLDATAFLLNGCIITDTTGNAADTTLPTGTSSLAGHKDIVVDTTRPLVASFTSPNADGTYGAFTLIEIDANFDEDVALVSGSPRLVLNNGAFAHFASVVDADTMRFDYSPSGGDDTPDLDVASFSLNGATINDLASNALLTTPLPAGPNSLAGARSIAIETTAPQVVSITSSAANGTYPAGSAIPVSMTFTEAIFLVGGTPSLDMNSGGEALYVSGSGTATLSFLLTVGVGEAASDLDVIDVNPNGARFLDGVGNDAVIALPGGANSLAGSKNIVIDTSAPAIDSIGTLAANGSYKAGVSINIVLTFTESVTVATTLGTPSLALNSGGGASAVYTSGSGTNQLSFLYTVAAGQNTPDLDALSLSMNGGTIRDAAGNNATTTMPATTLAIGHAIVIDTVAPTVSSVTSTPASAAYGLGGSLSIRLNISEPVLFTAGGTPTLSLNSGGAASFTSFATTTAMDFAYTVLAGHNASDLDGTALALSGSTVADAAGNALSTALPAGPSSLAGAHAIVVDTTAPAPTIASTDVNDGDTVAGPATMAFAVTFADALAVSGFDPQNPLDLDVANASISAVSQVGNTWNFSVTPGGNGPVSLQVLAGAAADAVGNSSAASSLFDFTFDTNTPSAVLLSGSVANGGYTNATSLPFTARFFASTPPMAGFDATNGGDLSVTNGTAGASTQSGNDWTFSLSTSADGTVSLQVLAGAATDSLARGNTASPVFSFTRDTAAPTVAISSVDVAEGATVNTPSSFAFQIAFADATPIIAFDPSGAPDLVVSGATVLVGTRTGNTWPLTVTPTGNGTVSLSIPAAAATDSAGNANAAGDSYSFVYDTIAPTASLSSIDVADGASANAPASFAFVATFTDATAVSGFDPQNSSDLSISGATASAGTPSGNTVAFTVTPSGQGAVALQILAGAASDAAGNPSTASGVYDFTYDTIAPTVALSSIHVANGATVGAPSAFTFAAAFSDALAVSGFDPQNPADLSVSGATVSAATLLASTYTFTVTPSGSGPVALQVLAGAASDAAGNASAASASFGFTYDAIAPTVVLSSVDVSNGAVVNAPASFSFTAAFSDTTSVTGFDPQNGSDFAVSGATVSAAIQTGNTWTFSITPTGGPVALQVLAGAASDAAGNASTASNAFAFTHDTNAPAASLSSVDVASGATVGAPSSFAFTASFADALAVSGFDPQNPADLSISGATASAASAVGNAFTFNVTPTGNGPVSLQVLAGAAADAAGNASLASTAFAFTYDTTAPTVVLASADVAHGATVGSPSSFDFTATFSDAAAVSGFDPQNIADLQVSGATISSVSQTGSTWSFTATPTIDGTVSLRVLAGAATDAAGNASAASNQFSFTYDTMAPTVSLASASVANAGTVGNPSTLSFTATFADAHGVSGFDPTNPADLSISGATASAATQVGNTYTFGVTPSGDGTVTLQVSAGAASDAAGNSSAASSTFAFTFDATAPVASLSSPDVTAGATIGSPAILSFTASFADSTPVSGFNPQTSDLVVTGPATVSGTGTTFSLTPTDNGTITLQIAASAATDAAGNANAASAVFSFEYLTVGPTVTLTSTDVAQGAVVASPAQMAFTAHFASATAVSGFDPEAASDLEVSGATVASAGRTGNDFHFVVTPSTDGPVSLRVLANAAQDAASNGSSASPPYSFTFDATAPFVEIISSTVVQDEECVCDPPLAFEILIGDATAVAFDLALDVVVTNGTASLAKQGGGNDVLFEVLPLAPGLVTIDVPAGALSDEAGNSNAAASFSFTWQDPNATGVGDWTEY